MAQLTKRGLIAAVVCSDTFMKLGTAQAKVFGVPDLLLLKVIFSFLFIIKRKNKTKIYDKR